MHLHPLVHAANLISLASFVVKDILWLRVLTIGAGLMNLFVLVYRPVPLWEGVGWNLVFFTINVAQIRLLILERRPVRLRDDEQRLYHQVFRSLTPREFVKLLALGTWEERRPEETIVSSGKTLDRIMIICDGKAAVVRDGRTIVELGEGRFVGEMSFLTGQVPGADVETLTDTRLVAWPSEDLRKFLEGHAELRASMQTVLGKDLVAKLRA
jgi:CRP-like cAMP-binding protein